MTPSHRYNVPAIYLLCVWWVIGAGVGWWFSWAPNLSATWGSLSYGFAGAALATALASYWVGNLCRHILTWLLWWAFALGSTTVIVLLAANRGVMGSSQQLIEAWQALGDFLPTGRNFTATWLGGILLFGIPFWVWSLDNVLSQSRSKTVSPRSQRLSFIILLLWFVPIFFVWQKQQTYFQYPYANATQTGHYRLLFATAIAISVGQFGFKTTAAFTTTELGPHQNFLDKIFDTRTRVRDSHIDLVWMKRLQDVSRDLEFSNCTFAPEVFDVAESYKKIFYFRECLQPEIVKFSSMYAFIEYQDFERIPLSFDQWKSITRTSPVRISVVETPKNLPNYLYITSEKRIYFAGNSASPTPQVSQ